MSKKFDPKTHKRVVNHMDLIRRKEPQVAEAPKVADKYVPTHTDQPMTEAQQNMIYLAGIGAKICNMPEVAAEFKDGKPKSPEEILFNPAVQKLIEETPQIMESLNKVCKNDVITMINAVDKSQHPEERHKDIDCLKDFVEKHLKDTV